MDRTYIGSNRRESLPHAPAGMELREVNRPQKEKMLVSTHRKSLECEIHKDRKQNVGCQLLGKWGWGREVNV